MDPRKVSEGCSAVDKNQPQIVEVLRVTRVTTQLENLKRHFDRTMTIQPKLLYRTLEKLATFTTPDTHQSGVVVEVGEMVGRHPDYDEAMEAWAALKRYRQFLDIHPPRSGVTGEAYQAGVKAQTAGLLVPVAPVKYQSEEFSELGEAWRMGWSHENAAHRADLRRASE
jgi:hypothetical protein